MKKLSAIFLIIILMLSGCAGRKTSETYKSEFFAMDTVMLLTVSGENAEAAAKACENEIYRLDGLLSTGVETSEISKLNTNGGGTVSAETTALLKRAYEIYGYTGGAFDVTVSPVVSAWGFYSGDYTVLSESGAAAFLRLVGSDKLLFEGDTVSFGAEGMAVDLGGIGKGYASDRLKTILAEQGIESALASLGGNVMAYGLKPDGAGWNIAVQDPDDTGGYVGILNVSDKMVVTSGGYQRYFEDGGKTYHHIIDPATGFPADSGLKSVTVVSADGTMADALSTALFVMGKDKAADFWRAHSGSFEAVLITSDDTVYITEGISAVFSSDRDYEVIKP